MDRAMSPHKPVVLQMRVLAARVLQLVGWAGVIGIALMLAASAIVALAWTRPVARVDRVTASDPKLASAMPRDRPSDPPPLRLPGKGEIPLLVTQIALAANASGLAWPAAEYKVVAATQEKPASLEVRCSLRGTYPKLRAMLARLIEGVPGFSLRELSMSRPSSEVAEVEAKIVMAVFLRDEELVEHVRQAEAKR